MTATLAAPPPRLWKTTEFFFLLLLAAIPFETINIGMTGRVTVAKLAGYVFFLFALLQPRRTLARRPAALWLLVFYVAVLACWLPFQQGDLRASTIVRIVSIVQMVILFWVVSNLCRDVKVAHRAVLAFSLSCAVLAASQIVGLTATMHTYGDYGERVSALGENLNTLGAVYSLAAVILIASAYARADVPLRWRWALAGVSLLLIVQIVRTGSRGSMLAFLGGLLTLALAKANFRVRLKLVVAVAAALAAVVWYSLTTEVVRARWEETTKQLDLSEREIIFPLAWGMFVERPMLGWGPELHYHELGWRMGEVTKETHNLYLWLLVEGGLVGALPHLTAIALCVLSAWRARRTAHGIVPFALCVVMLLINMSNAFHNRKLYWFVLAYGLAAGAPVVRRVYAARAQRATRRPVRALAEAQA